MELSDLGLDSWFEEQAKNLCGSDQRVARITAVGRGRYVVRNAQGEVPAELTGKFLYTADSSVDFRKSPGKNIEFQMIAANIDVAFIVQSS